MAQFAKSLGSNANVFLLCGPRCLLKLVLLIFAFGKSLGSS